MQSERLLLIPFSDDMFRSIFAGDMDGLGQLLHVRTPETWTEFKDAMDALPVLYDWFRSLPDPMWGSYFIIHRQDSELIGTAGYKGAPDADGMVEIGYEICSQYRRRGLATEAAAMLIEQALSQPRVGTIRAHTIESDGPSAVVLKKLNFSIIEKTMDPQDGEVFRWEFKRR